MYAMISGPAGPRDWDSQREIFHADARQMRTGVDDAGRPWIRIMGLDDYRADVTPWFDTTGFWEVETGREIRVFGNMAHAWSRYEARVDPAAPTPERRGINSIQLYKDETGAWRIISMIWDNERPGLPLPEIGA
jgi:hypothetical protein